MFTEFITIVNIADMYLDDRKRSDRFDRICDGDTGMRICAGIDDDAVIMIEVGILDLIDDGSFMIGLEERNFNVSFLCFSLNIFQEIFVALIAVDLFFSDAQHIEVGTVDHFDFHHHQPQLFHNYSPYIY